MSASFAELIGKTVVVDVDGPVIYLGRLAAAGAEFLTLEDADIHHLDDSGTSRERYIIEARKLGVGANRKRLEVRLARVVSVSRIEDVLEF